MQYLLFVHPAVTNTTQLTVETTGENLTISKVLMTVIRL